VQDKDRRKIKITKMDAVRRQLRTAIRLWFEDGDPVSTHTLIAAAHEILHTLFRRKGLHDFIFDTDLIKDEHRGEWARTIKANATFFKHAQRDADAVFEFSPFLNEMMLIHCISALNRMGEKFGAEEEALIHWVFINRPDFLKEDAYRAVPIGIIENFRRIDKKRFFEGYLLHLQHRGRS
jgi:hypothetical protein